MTCLHPSLNHLKGPRMLTATRASIACHMSCHPNKMKVQCHAVGDVLTCSPGRMSMLLPTATSLALALCSLVMSGELSELRCTRVACSGVASNKACRLPWASPVSLCSKTWEPSNNTISRAPYTCIACLSQTASLTHVAVTGAVKAWLSCPCISCCVCEQLWSQGMRLVTSRAPPIASVPKTASVVSTCVSI